MAATLSSFQNAHHFTVNHLAISTGSGLCASRSAFDLLKDNCAFGALYNSRERCDAPKCHPETRIAVQNEIFSWISHGDRDGQPKQVLWLSGPAGSGKTAIAGSIAKACGKDGRLAASFFFSSFSESSNRRTKRFLVATIAYQLIQCEGLETVRDAMLAAIDRDPAIFEKTLEDQLHELILKPLCHRDVNITALPRMVIVIDGIDEVQGESSRLRRRGREADQVEILNVLLRAAEDPVFPFRLLISSRPEHAIQEFFATNTRRQTLSLFLDEKYNADADVELFLRSKFSELRREYEMSPAWPSEDAIRALVEKASGH
ncbi:hypothetical protein NMY22_g18285 [Coprinellus aureogranulatus]|nr:hypothetical protein NMY22_g18285 [Coprinellus aureogranulatus]